MIERKAALAVEFPILMPNPVLSLKHIHALLACGAVILCSCSSPSPQRHSEKEFVRYVDSKAAPEMAVFAARAQKLGNEMYPKVCALLAEKDTAFPTHFGFSFKKRLARDNSGEARIDQICISAANLSAFKENPAASFDEVVVHEMAHVAQHYYRPLLGRWLVWGSQPPSFWQEGMADYVCFKLGQTNGWKCPQCGLDYPNYRDGYSCAGAFLLYLESTYSSNIVRRLNTMLRRGEYSDEFFREATGKSLECLWAEFQQTSAFTPSARRLLELQATLGYVNGKAPRNVEQRFQAFVNQHADAFTKDALKRSTAPSSAGLDLRTRMAVYLYLTQPGGSAETFIRKLNKDNRTPGFSKGEHSFLSGFLRNTDLDIVFPATRSCALIKQGDPSVYHYTVFRASSETSWKLLRAWRTTPDGKIAEEYPIP